MQFRFLTAGESHGEALVAIIEGLPSGLPFNEHVVNAELTRRQMCFGRSGRMKIEKDTVTVLSGIRAGKTIGSPITFLIRNKDTHTKLLPRLETPRPGHADLTGTLKFHHDDIRNTIERASARETSIRTAVGAICQNFLNQFDIFFLSFVHRIGSIAIRNNSDHFWKKAAQIDRSSILCPDSVAEKKMIDLIQEARKRGETLGGIFEIRVKGLPLGLGSFSQWDLRLDGRIAQAMMSIPAIKGVEIGAGFLSASMWGSQFQDEIFYSSKRKKSFGFYRKTNRSGGVEGGISTGEELVIRAAMKPLATLTKHPLKTINIFSKKKSTALIQRTDTCAAPAASVIARNVVAIEISKVFLEKFGGDSFEEVKNNYHKYLSLKY